MDNATEKLDNINKTLERQNEIIQKMLEAMPKPGHLFIRVLEMIVLFAGALGILNAADMIRHWVIGG